MPTYALYASASLYDRVVEECALPQNKDVQLGNSPVIGMPVPEGYPYLAKVTWTSARTVAVVDGRGREYELDPDNDVEIEAGPVTLRLSMAKQYPMRRVGTVSMGVSAVWLAIVLMSTITASAGDLVYERHCSWWPLAIPSTMVGLCGTGGRDGNDRNVMGIDVTAEYLARLLNEDYAGDERGVLVNEIERPDAEKRTEQFYMPAGSKGPVDTMGGAEEKGPEPIRTPEVEDTPVPKKKMREIAPLFAAEDVGTPIEELPEPLDPEDGIADAGTEGEDTDEPLDAPVEDVEGWGIPDWYDEEDAALEELEIDVMLKISKRRLRIDPDDAQALNILSYYQYLAEDFDAAEKTYDKYIELFPDEASGYNNKALIYKRLGQYGKEENLYRVALALEPDDVTAMNNLAVNLSHQGRQDEALAIMDQLEILDKGDPYADLHRSKVHAEVGADEKALLYLRKALEGMQVLDTLHHIEFRQDIRVDPSFAKLRESYEFQAILNEFYGEDTPLQD